MGGDRARNCPSALVGSLSSLLGEWGHSRTIFLIETSIFCAEITKVAIFAAEKARAGMGTQSDHILGRKHLFSAWKQEQSLVLPRRKPLWEWGHSRTVFLILQRLSSGARVAQWVGPRTQNLGVLGSIPGAALACLNTTETPISDEE